MITLATNLVAKATSQFDNWHFTSYAVINGQIYGTTSEGLYAIGGSLDDGTQIQASIVYAENDLGIPNSKKFPYVYFTVKTDTDFQFSVSTDRGPFYNLDVEVANPGFSTIRVPLTRECRGHVWTIKLVTKTSTYFSLLNLKGLPTILHAGRE